VLPSDQRQVRFVGGTAPTSKIEPPVTISKASEDAYATAFFIPKPLQCIGAISGAPRSAKAFGVPSIRVSLMPGCPVSPGDTVRVWCGEPTKPPPEMALVGESGFDSRCGDAKLALLQPKPAPLPPVRVPAGL
jgi:hypothetical protein